MSKVKVYHGSYCEVTQPSFINGRIDTDFGMGFYVTPDFLMAEKWACRKKTPVVNEYILDTTKLNIYEFGLDKNWLDFVVKNRNEYGLDTNLDDYDLLTGATADDKLFATIEQYESGFIDADTAVEVLNCIKIGQQMCIRTQKGLDNLQFTKSIILPEERVGVVRELNRADRKLANQLTGEIIRRRMREQTERKEQRKTPKRSEEREL